MRKWIVGATIVILLIAGGVVAQQRIRPQGNARDNATPAGPAAEPVAVEVAPVTRGTIEQTLALTGTVVSVRRAELTSRMPGRIAAVFVQEGARVGAGTAIAALETAELAASVSQAEHGVRQAAAAQELARARLAAVLAGARAQERAQLESAVAQAEAGLRNAESNVARMQELFDAGAVSRQQLDTVVLQRDVARSQLEATRQQRNLLEAGARDEDVRMARAQVAQADAGHAAAQAALRLARVQLANATIRAPFAGRVAELPVTLGEFVAPGMTAAVLYDDRALEVEVTVGERDLRLVRVGQPATVRPEASPATLQASVRHIQPSADPLSRAAKVRIRLAGAPGGLLPGTSVQAELLVERRADVLLVNSHALRQDGQNELVVVKDGVARVRRVVVGLRHHHIVQITYGVAEGELVVTLGPEALSDGQAVKVVSR